MITAAVYAPMVAEIEVMQTEDSSACEQHVGNAKAVALATALQQCRLLETDLSRFGTITIWHGVGEVCPHASDQYYFRVLKFSLTAVLRPMGRIEKTGTDYKWTNQCKSDKNCGA